MNRISKISVFSSLLVFVLISSLSVLLINNIVTVNKNIKEISDLKDVLNKTTQANNAYKLEIEKLISYDRIKKVSEENLGLKLDGNVIKETKSFKINLTDIK